MLLVVCSHTRYTLQGGDYMNEVEMDIMYNASCVPADQNEGDVLERA